jgi:ankyrin repeat protein
VETLLARGCDVNARDQSGATPLDEAAWKGHAGLVKLLLTRGASPAAGTLQQAVTKGHADVVKLLVEAGADPRAKDSEGSTMLELALRFRQRGVAETLMAKGVQLDSALRQRALSNAVIRGEPEIVDLLKPDAAEASTLLPDAVLKGHLPIAKVLVERGGNVNQRSASGLTPLHEASLGGHAATVQFLLERGAALNAEDTETGATPLHVAASYGRRDVLVVLLERGADPAKRNKAGKTPRDLAVEAQQTAIIAILDMKTR